MKKYLLGFFAIILAVGFSAFTKKEATSTFGAKYLVYSAGDESVRNNYSEPLDLRPEGCPGAQRVCWIEVNDANNDGVISQAEFDAAFQAIDGQKGGSVDGSLIDETEDDASFSLKL